jgi:hypothetical protein
MPNVVMQCHYAECHYAECRDFYCYAECRYAECRYAECHYAECRGALAHNRAAQGAKASATNDVVAMTIRNRKRTLRLFLMHAKRMFMNSPHFDSGSVL